MRKKKVNCIRPQRSQANKKQKESSEPCFIRITSSFGLFNKRKKNLVSGRSRRKYRDYISEALLKGCDDDDCISLLLLP